MRGCDHRHAHVVAHDYREDGLREIYIGYCPECGAMTHICILPEEAKERIERGWWIQRVVKDIELVISRRVDV